MHRMGAEQMGNMSINTSHHENCNDAVLLWDSFWLHMSTIRSEFSAQEETNQTDATC